MKKIHKSSSEILMKIVNSKTLSGNMTYRRILTALSERAFGIALLLFALPSALPFSAVPGVSFIFSLPIMIFATQIIFARKTLWLPKIIADRTISHKKISKIIQMAVPYLKKIERFMKPRWDFMTSRFMEIINGIVIFCLAILLMLPVPFSNFIFAALIVIFSLGIIERDGVFITVGYIGALAYISFLSVFILKAITAILNM
jgi:hypothetical protein